MGGRDGAREGVSEETREGGGGWERVAMEAWREEGRVGFDNHFINVVFVLFCKYIVIVN